jgi:hypothetical protein
MSNESNKSKESLPAAKRVFPARTLIQSPTAEQSLRDNPFAALDGLRQAPDESATTNGNQAEDASSGSQIATTERTKSYTQERQQQAKDTQDEQDADAKLRKQHVQLDRVRDNQGTVTVNDQLSTVGGESSEFTTRRFEYKTAEDGSHLVDTGLQQDIMSGGVQKCEDEPIHIPGAVQGFGVIITVREKDKKLIVHHVSEVCVRLVLASTNIRIAKRYWDYLQSICLHSMISIRSCQRLTRKIWKINSSISKSPTHPMRTSQSTTPLRKMRMLMSLQKCSFCQSIKKTNHYRRKNAGAQFIALSRTADL